MCLLVVVHLGYAENAGAQGQEEKAQKLNEFEGRDGKGNGTGRTTNRNEGTDGS